MQFQNTVGSHLSEGVSESCTALSYIPEYSMFLPAKNCHQPLLEKAEKYLLHFLIVYK